MGFAEDTGYTPSTIEELMLPVMENINTQFGTTYTAETFIGTNFYKYFYALMQEFQENDIKTSEIFLKLQQYFVTTNETISNPVVTNPGLVRVLGDAGYVASVKPPIDADAGKVYICVNVDDGADDYDETKLEIATIIKDSVVAGVITQGGEVESIVLSNGQAFDFKFSLPTEIPVLLKLTMTISENNQYVIEDDEVVKALLLEQINARYSLGKNFEPQKYFSVADAPWCSDILLEWSDDAGANYQPDVYDADFDDLFTFDLGDITLVVT